MKLALRLPVLLSLAVCCAAFALAAGSVVGTWKGVIVMDTSKLPKPKDANQQKMMDAGIAMVKKMKITLNLKADKTYAASFSGGPDGASKTSTGKWSQSGTTVTMTPQKDGGKPVTGEQAKPQKLTVSADGKTLTMSPPSQGGMSVKIVFSR